MGFRPLRIARRAPKPTRLSCLRARSLGDQLRELAIQADVSRTEKVAALLEAAWALALDLSPNRTNHNRRTR